MYPTETEIKNLHLKYSPSKIAFDIIFPHCEIIWQICDQIIASGSLKINKNLVKAGALLHDIGAYKLIDKNGVFDELNYIKHGIIGYNILKNAGFDEDLCRISKCHTGLGLTKEYIKSANIDLPIDDYLAETIEERLVMYADKFHSKNPRFNTFESYRKTALKFGEENTNKFDEFAKEFGIPNLNCLSKNYRTKIA